MEYLTIRSSRTHFHAKIENRNLGVKIAIIDQLNWKIFRGGVSPIANAEPLKISGMFCLCYGHKMVHT